MGNGDSLQTYRKIGYAARFRKCRELGVTEAASGPRGIWIIELSPVLTSFPLVLETPTGPAFLAPGIPPAVATVVLVCPKFPVRAQERPALSPSPTLQVPIRLAT